MPIRSTFAALSLIALFVSAGCGSSHRADVRVRSDSTGEVYSQVFPTGVASVTNSGDTDLVLTCRTEPTAGGPAVDHTLHVRMLWKNDKAIPKALREINRNAALNWYVTRTGEAAGGMLHYRGTGLVELSRDGDQVTLRVIESSLSPTNAAGGMADPIGPSTLSGTLTAKVDPAQTLAKIGDIRAAVVAHRVPKTAEAKIE